MIKVKQLQGGSLVEASISGLMTLADQHVLEDMARRIIDGGQAARLLVMLDDFEGWEKNTAWGEDLDFQFAYGGRIDRVAIVADPSWKDQALLFAGKGFRETHIEFFPRDEADQARLWVERT